MDPRQNEESSVVHDPLQVASPLLVTPADPGVSRLHLPGRRGPQQTRQLPLLMAHPIAQVRAERHATSQIVIPCNLLTPPAALRLAFHQGQLQRFARAGGACHGHLLATRLRCICAARTPPTQLPYRGKLQEAFGLQPLPQLPALVVLQPSMGTRPLQQLADGPCDCGYAKAENSCAVWRIKSSSPATNVRPQKMRDSGMQSRVARIRPRRAQYPR